MFTEEYGGVDHVPRSAQCVLVLLYSGLSLCLVPYVSSNVTLSGVDTYVYYSRRTQWK